MLRNIAIIILFALIIPLTSFGDRLIKDLVTVFGDGSGSDVVLEANVGNGSANPKLKFNNTDSVWQFSADGTEFFDFGSGSGGAGDLTNYMPDPSFESGEVDELVPMVTCPSNDCLIRVKTYESLPVPSPAQNKHFGEVFSPVDQSFFVQKDIPTYSGMEGRGAFFSIALANSTGEDLVITPRVDGVDRVDLQFKVAGDYIGLERYSVPLVFGSSSIGFRVDATSSGLFLIDDIYLGEIPKGYIQTVGDNNSDWIPFTPTGDFTTNVTYKGRYRRVGDSMEIMAQLDFSGNTNTTDFTLDIPLGLTIDTDKLTDSTGGEALLGSFLAWVSGSGNSYGGKVIYNSPTDIKAKALQPVGASNNVWGLVTDTSPLTYIAGRGLSVHFIVPIQGWTTGRKTVVTQSNEETVKTANVFKVRIASNGVVVGDPLGIIDGNCTVSSTGFMDCSFVSGVFTVTPFVSVGVCENGDSSDRVGNARNVSAGGFGSVVYNTQNTKVNQTVCVTISKLGSDYNKSQTIGGTFSIENFPNACFPSTYSETEIKCGIRNGEQLYRRCFTVASDITSNATITTWDSGLTPVNSQKRASDYYLLSDVSFAWEKNTDFALIDYRPSTGTVGALVANRTIYAGTSFCMDYTK